MAEEIARLEKRLRSVETRQLKSQHSIYSADVEQEELIFEVHQLYSWLEDVSVKQQYIENCLEQFAKVQEQMEDRAAPERNAGVERAVAKCCSVAASRQEDANGVEASFGSASCDRSDPDSQVQYSVSGKDFGAEAASDGACS